MFDIFLLNENLPFTVALAVALFIGIIEIISLLIGGISSAFDGILPEKDIHIDLDGGFSITDYLCIGKIPLLMWIVVFLVSYGLCGIIMQMFLNLNVYLAGFIMLPLSLFPTRYISLFLHKIMPQDFTTAIHSDNFVGMKATIVMGNSYVGHPAQAKFKDRYDQTHYVMVEPEYTIVVFTQGDEVILTSKKTNTLFTAVKYSI